MEERGKFVVGGDNDLSEGPVSASKRRCTDVFCLALFVAHAVAFWVLSLLYAGDGSPWQLYYPRDYQGQYCGLEKQWRDGAPELGDFRHLIYTLDFSETIEPIAHKFLCSEVGLSAADAAGVSSSNYSAVCQSVSRGTLSDVEKELEQFTTYNGVASLLSDGVAGSGISILGDVNKYFNEVCVRSCDVSFTGNDGGSENTTGPLGGSFREYTFMPAGDATWHSVWKQIAASTPSLLGPFTFQALPRELCPYQDAKYCVPLPGVTFKEAVAGYCAFDLKQSAWLPSLSAAGTEYLDRLARSSLAEELKGTADQAFGAIETTWDTFVLVSALAFLLGFISLVLLRFFVKPLVWLAVVLVFVLLGFGGVITYTFSSMCEASSLDPGSVSDALEHPFADDPCMGSYKISDGFAREVLRYSSFVLWALAALYAILALCITGRIRLAIAVNAVAAQFVYNTPHILLVPVVQALGAITWTALWLATAVFLLSQVPHDYVPAACFTSYNAAYEECVTSKSQAGLVWKDDDSDECTDGCCWMCAPPRYTIDYRFLFSVFSFFWHHALAVALGQCIIAGAVGVWFFNKGERGSLGASIASVCTSLRNALRFHLGSLAFGALIIAVIQTVKWLMRYLAKQAQVHHNKLLEVIFKALACCVWCFEKSMKFLNKNAYIQVALLGKPFCTSARNAFFLILRNAVRFGVLAGLGAIIHFIGQVMIAVATAVLGFLILEAMHPDVSMPVVLVIIYAALGYMCGVLFMNVFGLAVDTTLQCFLATEEMGIDRGFVPPKLQAFIKFAPNEKETRWAAARDSGRRHPEGHGSCFCCFE